MTQPVERALMVRVFSLLALALVGCARPTPDTRGIRAGGRDVSLRFEGTCAHLACRSSYGQAVPAHTPGAFACGADQRGAPAGWFTPAFTCDPVVPHRFRQPGDGPFLTCNDQQRWLSLPGLTQAECGERYLVCHRGVRALAIARDRSAANASGRQHFEASLGLLHAIGGDPTQRETMVSVYALWERERIAADPQCVGTAR
ncbi:MAG TPA: hypothetical protein VFZ61_06220 [Polyangiales bacterium]